MSDLSMMEKRKLERALGMSSGYVLDFCNRTFEEFILDCTGIEIYDSKYDYASGSKANRLRAFWDIESNYTVGRLLGEIFDNWDELNRELNKTPLPEECLKIVQRLKTSAPVPDIGAVEPNTDEKDFETLAKSVRESIDRNEPEIGLDRLHTFVTKYFRVLCKKHGITTEWKKPLHSLVGEYVRFLKNEGLIESEMTERILKSSISVMEAFNKVRNQHSYAHDNEVLSYDESLLIFGHVTSSIRFIETIENSHSRNSHGTTTEPEIDDISF
jgi:hypothetical protein